MNKKLHMNNKGFSFIEAIVIVTIIAISLTLVSASISTIFSLSARRCSDDIDSLLSKTKVSAMSKTGDTYLAIYKNSTGIVADYYEDDTLISSEVIGKDSISLYYTDTDGTVHDSITALSPLYISYDRSTGRLLDIFSSTALAGGIPAVSSDDVFCESISVSSGGKTYTIVLVPTTGKHFVTVLGVFV